MKKIYILLVSTLVLLSSCEKDVLPVRFIATSEFSSQVPLTWNKLFLEMERYTSGYKPPVSARTIAYINLAAYEAVVHGSGNTFNSFYGHFQNLHLPQPDPNLEYNWEVCMQAAYEKAFEYFFATAPSEQQFQMIGIASDLRSKMQSTVDPNVFQRSYEFGREVAESVNEWSEMDEWGHRAYLKNNDLNFYPPKGDGLWAPTYPDFQPALLPHWGKVRTFAALDQDQAAPPLEFNTSDGSPIFKEAKETYALVNAIKAGSNKEDHWIAQFWSDDCPILTFSPAGRWISITNQVLAAEQSNLMESAYAYAKVSLALSDAGVKCWGEKYRHNCLRPIDYIRKFMGDQTWNTVMCPDGSGEYYTPPFPTYPSGHATFGAAAATVLEDLFGTNYPFTDRSHEFRTEFDGRPRSFNSFWEMALENGYSRVPLGVHFEMDSRGGIGLGQIIGSRVNNLPWK